MWQLKWLSLYNIQIVQVPGHWHGEKGGEFGLPQKKILLRKFVAKEKHLLSKMTGSHFNHWKYILKQRNIKNGATKNLRLAFIHEICAY